MNEENLEKQIREILDNYNIEVDFISGSIIVKEKEDKQ